MSITEQTLRQPEPAEARAATARKARLSKHLCRPRPTMALVYQPMRGNGALGVAAPRKTERTISGSPRRRCRGSPGPRTAAGPSAARAPTQVRDTSASPPAAAPRTRARRPQQARRSASTLHRTDRELVSTSITTAAGADRPGTVGFAATVAGRGLLVCRSSWHVSVGEGAVGKNDRLARLERARDATVLIADGVVGSPARTPALTTLSDRAHIALAPMPSLTLNAANLGQVTCSTGNR